MRNMTTVLLLSAATVIVPACIRRSAPAGLGEVEAPRVVPAADGITVSAAVPDDPRAMRSLFKADLPAAGVVPVYVTVSNRDTAAVVLHSRGGLALGGRFGGFVLETQEGALDPIHPLEVAMRLEGIGAPPNYRRVGAWHAVGGAAVPPLGVYFIYQWGKYALKYRPLLRRSLFPAARGGWFEPLIVEAGGTAAGFLFFALAPESSPYYSETNPAARRGEKPEVVWKVRSESRLELLVRPSAFPSGAAARALESAYEIASLREVRSDEPSSGAAGANAPPAGGAPDRDLFLLGKPFAERGKLELYFGAAGELLRSRSTAGFAKLGRLGGDTGEIADAARYGRYAVCAVNFKQKSRLMLVETGAAGAALCAEVRLQRRVLRVYARSDGMYVITDDGYCGVYRYGDLKRSWYGRLATSAGETILFDGRLVVFGGGQAAEFECAGGRCAGPLRSVPAPARSIRQGAAVTAREGAPPRVSADAGFGAAGTGPGASAAILVHCGSGARGDTLVSYDTVSLRETSRLPLPGRIEALAAAEGVVIGQVEGGVLVRLEPGAGGVLAVTDAGWLAASARALVVRGAAVIALAKGGNLYAFDFEAVSPAPFSARSGSVTRAPVGIAPPARGGAETD